MCIICLDIQKDKLTPREIAKNYSELVFEDDHWADVIVEIEKKGLTEKVSKELIKLREELG